MVGSGSQDGGARWCHRMMCLHRCQSTLLYHYPSLCHATVLITGQLRFHEMIDKYKMKAAIALLSPQRTLVDPRKGAADLLREER